MRGLLWFLSFVLFLAVTSPLIGSSLEPMTDDGAWREADAVCRGRLVRARSVELPSGEVRTRVVVEVEEVLKGRLGKTVVLSVRGGQTARGGESSGEWSSLPMGEERVVYLKRTRDGVVLARGADSLRMTADSPRVGSRLLASRALAKVRVLRRSEPKAGLDLTAESAVPGDEQVGEAYSGGGGGGAGGLSVDGSGIPARWLAADRGEPIPYLVDAQALPLGISQAQALGAVEQALASWSAVTSLTFRFEGLQQFGQSSATITTPDERLRIQLHDLYGQLTSSSVLGLGGRGFTNGDSLFATAGGAGGQVAGQEFHRVTRGYVVLQHSSAAMRTLSTFTEVLCHEIGHVLGLAHSSENPTEPNALLREAVMYYRAHADGRGAALGNYDPPVVQKAYPMTDTPPFSYSRVLYLITAPVTPNLPGVNEVRLLGSDRQTPEASLTIVNGPSTAGSPSPVGAWSRSGTLVKFTPNAYYGDQTLDPSGTSFFARAFYRFSDGTHCSPWITVRMLGFQTDTFPGNGGDGVPDEWMTTFFGSPNPSAGPKRGPNDDFDSDGSSNVSEFRNSTDPTDFHSKLELDFAPDGALTWPAAPYEVYVIESSSDFTSWGRFRAPVLPTTTEGAMPAVVAEPGNRQFFRLRRQE